MANPSTPPRPSRSLGGRHSGAGATRANRETDRSSTACPPKVRPEAVDLLLRRRRSPRPEMTYLPSRCRVNGMTRRSRPLSASALPASERVRIRRKPDRADTTAKRSTRSSTRRSSTRRVVLDGRPYVTPTAIWRQAIGSTGMDHGEPMVRETRHGPRLRHSDDPRRTGARAIGLDHSLNYRRSWSSDARTRSRPSGSARGARGVLRASLSRTLAELRPSRHRAPPTTVLWVSDGVVREDPRRGRS